MDVNINSLDFRKLTLDDLDDITRLEKEIFPNPWSRESLNFELAHRTNSVAYKILFDNRIIAYCFSWIIIDEFHIGNFAVIKEFRKMGIGKKFLKFIIDRGKELGASFFYLEVRKSNLTAIKLYEKFGFKTLGIRREYYSDNREDAIVMGLNI